jgi:hypothetical protein
MMKIKAALGLIILFGLSFAGAEDAARDEANWDWLGAGPIYSYGGVFNPYYTHYPTYIYTPPSYGILPVYADPFQYSSWPYADQYLGWIYPPRSWWIGAHKDLTKTLDIARTGSSIRIYSNGLWRTP